MSERDWGWRSVRDRCAAARRTGRSGLTLAFAAVLVLAAGACGPNPASPAPSTASATASAGASGNPGTGAIPPSPIASSGATLVDSDDEAGSTSIPGSSFTPGPTGVAIASPGPASPADRLPGEPDPALTPGVLNPDVTQATIGSTICVSGWTATIRPPSGYTTGLKIQQIAQYGYTDTSTADYEEDHLISLELGGSPTDPRNLWPEPYTAGLADGRSTSAHVKDGFETKLKNEVCSGTITLGQAQSEIGDHWVHAYYGIAIASSSPVAAPST